MNRVSAIAADVTSRRRSAEEIARKTLEGIAHVDDRVRAFLSVDEELTLREAREVDRRAAAGENLPLAGVMAAVKDNLTVAGRPATCASRILEGFRPGYDATAIERLKRAGAVVAGKTNMDEFAMGSSTENSSTGPTRNPWDPDRVPGGSSGGSAAAVACGAVPVSLGSDTGGSVRQPAAFCGVVGLKPSYGRVSRYGLIAFASSLDQIGPIAAGVEDCARVYAVLAGHDERDSTSSTRPVGDPIRAVSAGAAGIRVGLMRESSEQRDPEISANLKQSLEALTRAGARVEEVSVPHAPYAIPIYYVVANAEASSNLARFDGVRYGPRLPVDTIEQLYVEHRTRGFGAEVKRRILLGTFALSAGYAEAYYQRASRARRLLAADFDEAFRKVDVIVCPTTPGPAFRLGERVEDPLSMYLSDIFTTPASLAGIPAISVPSGRTAVGLPLGFQIMAPWWQEERLFSVAAAFEKEIGFGDVVAPVSA